MSYIGKVFCENEVLEVFQQGIHLKLPRRCEIFRKVYTKLPVKMKIRNLNLKPICKPNVYILVHVHMHTCAHVRRHKRYENSSNSIR